MGASEDRASDGAQRTALAPVCLLDVDGTLVDTNYQHALAWFRAFRRHRIVLPVWRIHRHIGMGGDQLVRALTDDAVERELGERIRSAHDEFYGEMIGEVEALQHATELIGALRGRGQQVVLASSAKREELERYVELLAARELASAWTCAEDVSATKPQPDLVNVALEQVGARAEQAVMVGDSPWDAHAADRAGVQTVAVMTGGFSEQELREAGAAEVYESLAHLCGALDRSILGARG